MPAIDFPNSPSVNDTFAVGERTWKWTGTTWDAVVDPVGVASGGTQGQVLTKTGNTNYATTWSNTVSSVIGGTGLTGGGTSGGVTLNVDTTTIQARVANVTDTEIGYLDGVTSAIQTQLDAKAATASTVSTIKR
jgi:hypothetical protein